MLQKFKVQDCFQINKMINKNIFSKSPKDVFNLRPFHIFDKNKFYGKTSFKGLKIIF